MEVPGTNHHPESEPEPYQQLLHEIRALRADMQALQEQLRAGGYLDKNWTPPSLLAPPAPETGTTVASTTANGNP